MSAVWEKCLENLKSSLPLQDFSLWIKPLKVKETSTTISIFAPNKSVKDHIQSKLRDAILNSISQINPKLEVLISTEKTRGRPTSQSDLYPDYTFDNLVLGDANQMAYSATMQIAKNLSESPYNPFIIYGGSGLGKTHLMQAAGHLVRSKSPDKKVIYLPLMDFVRNITNSIRHNKIEEIKEYYQSADLLLVDDIHLIGGKEKSQEEFFHIFNFLFNTKKQIIFTCDQEPNRITTIESRLRTRFSQGLNLKLSPPELEMRAAILLKKSQSKKINLPISNDIALHISGHISSNVRDLEGALLKLKAYCDFTGIAGNLVTKDIVEKALGDIIKPQIFKIDINDIQRQTAKHYAVTVSDLSSKSRKQHNVLARQMAIYITHELTGLSTVKIGNNFGNRDHTTVLHAIKKINTDMASSEDLRNDYEVIKLKLANL